MLEKQIGLGYIHILVGMMIGGIAALIFQTDYPLLFVLIGAMVGLFSTKDIMESK